MDNPFNAPLISVCTGLRGLERGIERALGKPLRVATYVEVETFIIENLLAGMEAGLVDAAPVWANLKTFNAKPFHGKIGGIIGGYPCPGESLAGLRELHKYHGWLWPYLRNVIDAVRPFYCYFENVAAHVTGTYPIVYRSLRRMGYAVEAGIYTAQEVGAPHLRERLFILALDHASLHRLKQETAITNTDGEERNTELDNTTGSGSPRQGRAESGNAIEADEPQTRCWYNGTDTTLWPSGPGPQHEWEEPRTVEPGMGCTVNGYNFREDLLRAFGNSVVEQTAELAFVDLLNKFLKPH